MSRVEHLGHGVYCYKCQEVSESTDGCEHDLSQKAGVRRATLTDEEYFAQPANMGHNGPHHFMDVDGMEMSAECNGVKIPSEMVEGSEA